MIKKADKIAEKDSIVLLLEDGKNLKTTILKKDEIDYALKQNDKNKKELIAFNRLNRWIFVQFIKKEANKYKRLENCRIAGEEIVSKINDQKIPGIVLSDLEGKPAEVLAYAEGMALGNYQFLRYKKDPGEKKNSLDAISIISTKITKSDIAPLNIVVESTCICRDLINEPVASLNAVKLSEEIAEMGARVNATVEIFNKKKIESLKMGGLLAVNKGSLDPPTFTIIEWKSPNPVNKKPYIFVGKGVTYDTGGLNIKTGTYMDNMKSDMSGAAAASSAIYAIAKAKLPVHVIALIPATDNRLNGNAYVSGDVIQMHNGLHVEVLNTDAEGRMILADALSYAKKYDPALVIDLATLTGAAAIAIGKFGIVAMGTKSDEEMTVLKKSGEHVYERLVEFPFWEEYGELIKSDIADIKNIGGKEAGAITAGKFLEHFTDYPYIHLDIAGPAFVDKKFNYRGQGGTGIGVRLLFDFIQQKSVRS
ncbi:MAG: leucyl aminopeptidase family protein [Bacteroidales bacterium]|nr:leucyl aminopeptidase family protein [Bacteroidales bacterium]